MKQLFTIIIIFSSFQLIAQKDTIKVKPTEIALERLRDLETKINESKKKFDELTSTYNDYIEIILGVRKEDIESLQFKDGKFLLVVKQK